MGCGSGTIGLARRVVDDTLGPSVATQSHLCTIPFSSATRRVLPPGPNATAREATEVSGDASSVRHGVIVAMEGSSKAQWRGAESEASFPEAPDRLAFGADNAEPERAAATPRSASEA